MKKLIAQGLQYGFRLRNKTGVNEIIFTPARRYGVQMYYRAELSLHGWGLTRVVRITPGTAERMADNKNFDFFVA